MEPTALLLEESKKRVVCHSPNPQGATRNPAAWMSFKAILTPPTPLQILSALLLPGLIQKPPKNLLSCFHIPTKPSGSVMLAYWGNLNMRELQQEEDIQLHPQKPHVNAVLTFSPFGPGGPWKYIRRIRVKKQQNRQCTQHPNQGDSIHQFTSLSHICYYFKLYAVSHEQHATEKHQQGPACSYQDRGPAKDRGGQAA